MTSTYSLNRRILRAWSSATVGLRLSCRRQERKAEISKPWTASRWQVCYTELSKVMVKQGHFQESIKKAAASWGFVMRTRKQCALIFETIKIILVR